MRVVYWGNRQNVFSNRHFAALLQTPCDIAAVVDVPPAKRASTNPAGLAGAPSFADIAAERAIPYFAPDSPNAPEFIAELRPLQPDLYIAVGYMNLLKEEVLGLARVGAVNFHASLLPAYRGKHPVFWALRNGEKWAGLTVHALSLGLDTGDILYQVKVRTRKRDSVERLYDRIMAKSVTLIPRLIADAAAGRLHGRAQAAEGASYYSSVKSEDFALSWSQPAEQIRRWIYTTPGKCFITINGVRFFPLEAEATADSWQPGTLLAIGRRYVTVATGQGAIRLGRVRLETGEVKKLRDCPVW